MDTVDREILSVLQQDGRITATDLAKRIRLSLSATSERLRQLQTSGVIRGFAAIIDPVSIGRQLEALVDVRLSPGAGVSRPQEELDDIIATFPAIIDAMHLTGRFDTQLRIAAKDVAELDALLVRIKEELAAEETNTRLVLRTIKGFPRSVL